MLPQALRRGGKIKKTFRSMHVTPVPLRAGIRSAFAACLKTLPSVLQQASATTEDESSTRHVGACTSVTEHAVATQAALNDSADLTLHAVPSMTSQVAELQISIRYKVEQRTDQHASHNDKLKGHVPILVFLRRRLS